ncbi:MAG: type II secretion system minor pseudopilin GspI [Lysobacter sp.]|jgi:general secretion pathway protein I|nr:type II secretion system minor pseudopilin GspI [Lysobacter sp.]MDV5979899.1 type II secretion system minor pseudopilin GspI [Lysobacter sp.]
MRHVDARWPGRVAGFSLIELLVAVSVFSLTVLALLNLAGENTRSAMVIEQQVLAGVVADNRAVEAMMATPAQLASAVDGGEVVLGDRTWRWTRRVAATEVDAMVRIDVAVMPADEDRVAAEATLYREAP